MAAQESGDLEATERLPRVTRRGLLRGLGAGVVGVSLPAIVAACGGNSNNKSTNTSNAAPASTTTTAPAAATTGSAPTTAAASATSPAASSSFTPPTITSGSHSLKLLMWSHFVPAFDTYFDKWAKDWGSTNKVSMTIDHIPTNTVTTKAAAEVAAGTGHDMILFQTGSDPHVYSSHLVDVSDLANYFGNQYGGYVSIGPNISQINGKWVTIPDFVIQYPGLYRKDLFDAAGLKPPDQWADLIPVGQKLKPQGHPVGIAINQNSGDSNASLISILAGYGASWVDTDGKTITINSQGTKDAIAYVQQLYKEAMTPEVLSWDDSSNNQLLDSGVGSYILNPISAYRSASQDLQNKIAVSIWPGGPKGRQMIVNASSWAIMSWTKEQSTAEKFLVDYFAQYLESFKASTGYNFPILKGFQKKPMPILGADPKLNILQDMGDAAISPGWPGPATAAAGEVNNTYVIPNMFAKAVTGSSADQAIAFAEQQIKGIYAKYPGG